MEITKNAAVDVVLTLNELRDIADCSSRMAGYEDATSGLVIAVIYSRQGEPVRLILDKHCIQCEEKKNGTLDSS